MTSKQALFSSLFAAVILAAAPASIADSLSGQITLLNGPASMGLGPNGVVVVGFDVRGSESKIPPDFSRAACRYTLSIDNGAGIMQRWDFSETNRPMFPKRASATFPKAGRYTVTARADSSSACDGTAHTEITIEAAPSTKPTPTPANPCPPSWTRKPGPAPRSGFECVPVKPAPMPCPHGTNWFAEAGSVGCRP